MGKLYKKLIDDAQDDEYRGFIFDKKKNRYFKSNNETRKQLIKIEGALLKKQMDFEIYDDEFIMEYIYSRKFRFSKEISPSVENFIHTLKNWKRNQIFQHNVYMQYEILKSISSNNNNQIIIAAVYQKKVFVHLYSQQTKFIKNSNFESRNNIQRVVDLHLFLNQKNTFNLIIITNESFSIFQIKNIGSFQIIFYFNYNQSIQLKSIIFNESFYFINKKGILSYVHLNKLEKKQQKYVMNNVIEITHTQHELLIINKELKLFFLNKQHKMLNIFRLGVNIKKIQYLLNTFEYHYILIQSDQENKFLEINRKEKKVKIISAPFKLENFKVQNLKEFSVIYGSSSIFLLEFHKLKIYQLKNQPGVKYLNSLNIFSQDMACIRCQSI